MFWLSRKFRLERESQSANVKKDCQGSNLTRHSVVFVLVTTCVCFCPWCWEVLHGNCNCNCYWCCFLSSWILITADRYSCDCYSCRLLPDDVHLSTDLLLQIFAFLDPRALANSSAVCRYDWQHPVQPTFATFATSATFSGCMTGEFCVLQQECRCSMFFRVWIAANSSLVAQDLEWSCKWWPSMVHSLLVYVWKPQVWTEFREFNNYRL